MSNPLDPDSLLNKEISDTTKLLVNKNMKFIDWLKIEIDEDLPALLKGLKEAGRVTVLAIIPVAIVQINNGVFDIKAIYVVGGIAFLRFIDKWLHERQEIKPNYNKNKGLLGIKGLTGF